MLLATGLAAQAESFSADKLLPTTVFVQAGRAEANTQSYVVGARWDWGWRRSYSFGTLTGFSEISFGRWVTEDERRSATWATQIGLTPVVRLHPASARDWFAEIGVGANLIVPLFRSQEKRFSTEFNFGDHVAVGYQFGERRQQELSLRFQHFSNAGIDEPNPGENFLQLRYSHRF
jgi:hypothetical protein